MKQLENESRELKEELNSYQFEYDELWKKLDVQEENKLLSRDIEWLNRESSMKDKLLSEKVDMINNLLQKVSTTSIPLDNSDKSATVNQSNQSIPNVPYSRNHHIIHLIGDSLIIPVIPELLFPSDFKAEIKKSQCFVFDEVNNFKPDPQAKIVVVHCGTDDIANCSNINDVLTLDLSPKQLTIVKGEVTIINNNDVQHGSTKRGFSRSTGKRIQCTYVVVL